MVERHFLGWDKPLLTAAIEWLLERRAELPAMMVVVPTAQGGRRLREALAEANIGLSPRVVTPEEFFRIQEDETIASEAEERLAWIEVLRGLKSDEAQALFPVQSVERGFGWAAGVARELISVRAQLAEAGKRFADVVDVSPEQERWRDLERIELRVLKLLESWGKTDRAAAKISRAAAFPVPPEVSRLIIAGVPDPVPLAVTAWQHLAGRNIAIDVLIHAPLEEREHFDAWGRPVDFKEENNEKKTGVWTRRTTPVARDQAHLTTGAAEFGNEVVKQCAGMASNEVAIGLCDASFSSALETAFEQAGWKAWNPDGRVAGTAHALLLENLAAWQRQPQRWEKAAAVVRHPLLGGLVATGDWHAALRALDELENDYLPDTPKRVAQLIANKQEKNPEQPQWQALGAGMTWIDGWRQRFQGDATGQALLDWAAMLREKECDDGADGQWIAALEDVAQTIARMEKQGLFSDGGDALDLAMATLGEPRSSSGREEAVIDLLGWLELSYETAGRLVLAGMHEGCVPDGSLDDAFLPDGVRAALGLRDAASRLTRDAFLFHALTASRRVEVVVAKVDAKGEPKKPSRLLLVDHGEALAQRVQDAFGAPDGLKQSLPGWERGQWQLRFDGAAKFYLDGDRELSPSAIKDYLSCPFRFYLKRVLKWDRYKAGKQEMDAMDFGNVCHRVLEAMALDETAKSTHDVRWLQEFLIDRLDEDLRRYGTPLSLPLLVQRASAMARLERFAEKEIEQRLDGWVTQAVELKIGKDLAWHIDGQPMQMQIDRVDYHPDHGWRVLDYKTSGKAAKPADAHLRAISDARRRFGPEVTLGKGKSKAWSNLQLPLYAAYVKEHFAKGEQVQAGYVNLPTATSEVGFNLWQGFNDDLLDGALACAAEVIAALRDRLHWPPVEFKSSEASWDDFAELAPDGLANAVSGDLIDELRDIAETYQSKEVAV